MPGNTSDLGFAYSTTTGSVAATSASVATLLATNPHRKAGLFFNDSTATLFLKFGPAASSADFTVKLGQDDYYELPKPTFTGSITGRWTATTGSVKVTEIC